MFDFVFPLNLRLGIFSHDTYGCNQTFSFVLGFKAFLFDDLATISRRKPLVNGSARLPADLM